MAPDDQTAPATHQAGSPFGGRVPPDALQLSGEAEPERKPVRPTGRSEKRDPGSRPEATLVPLPSTDADGPGGRPGGIRRLASGRADRVQRLQHPRTACPGRQYLSGRAGGHTLAQFLAVRALRRLLRGARDSGGPPGGLYLRPARNRGSGPARIGKHGHLLFAQQPHGLHSFPTPTWKTCSGKPTRW